MKVLFLNPPFKTEFGKFSRTSRSPAVTKSGTVYYPIWLAYAAGNCEKHGNVIEFIDSCAYRLSLKETLDKIDAFNPDMVLLDTSTPSIISDLNVVNNVKKQNGKIITCVMGTHPSALPKETLELEKQLDIIIRGEVDDTIVELSNINLNYYHKSASNKLKLLNKIKGISFQVNGELFHNVARPQIKELDDLPFVSQVYKKYLDVNKYFFAACDYPMVMIMSERGCTDRCTFCVYPYTIHGLKYRMRSAENLVNEFEWIEKNMPEVKEIGIEDDNFSGSKKRIHDFCNLIINKNINIKWYTNVRVNIDYETLLLMKKANCVLLTVGYESANQEVLDIMKKKIKTKQIIEFSNNCRKAKIMVHSCFMVGNPYDTKETLKQSLDLALTLNDDTMQFFPLIVYPGTPDYEWAKENNLMTVNSYDQWVTKEGYHNSVVRMKDMSGKEIVDWCDYARKKYYLRPKYLFYKLFQSLFVPSEFVRNIKAGLRFQKFLRKGTFNDKSFKNIDNTEYISRYDSKDYATNYPEAKIVPKDYEKNLIK